MEKLNSNLKYISIICTLIHVVAVHVGYPINECLENN